MRVKFLAQGNNNSVWWVLISLLMLYWLSHAVFFDCLTILCLTLFPYKVLQSRCFVLIRDITCAGQVIKPKNFNYRCGTKHIFKRASHVMYCGHSKDRCTYVRVCHNLTLMGIPNYNVQGFAIRCVYILMAFD